MACVYKEVVDMYNKQFISQVLSQRLQLQLLINMIQDTSLVINTLQVMVQECSLHLTPLAIIDQSALQIMSCNRLIIILTLLQLKLTVINANPIFLSNTGSFTVSLANKIYVINVD